jgi:hypothetical protein
MEMLRPGAYFKKRNFSLEEMMREPGKATTPEDRAGWPIDRLVKETKKLIRTDWGGLAPEEGATKKLVDLGVSEDVAANISRQVAALCQRQIKGCRDRCSHNFDELLRRMEGS